MTSVLLFHPFRFHMDMINVLHPLGEEFQIREDAGGHEAEGDEREGKNDVVIS